MIKEISELTWWMRGSVTYSEAWGLSHEEREIMITELNTKMEKHKNGQISF